MKKQVIYTPNAPSPVGGYSQAIQIDNMLFISGQVSLDVKTGEMIGNDIRTQTEHTLKNLIAILTHVGATIEQVVKTTCFLSTMEDYAVFNEVYIHIFSKNKPANLPARSCIAATLPKQFLVEIEAIAVL